MTPEKTRIKETMELTITIPLPVSKVLNLLATEILSKSVMKYDNNTIEKNKIKFVKDFPLAGEETIVTPPQKIKTPTFKILIAKPFAASPK